MKNTSEIQSIPGASPNAEAIEAWNTVLFDKFARFRDLITAAFAPHGSALIDRCQELTGARVVDLGCGFGDTTVELARRVGPGGEVTGIDASPRFVAEGRSLASARASAARFAVADVQVDPLGRDLDVAYSRFGLMFFASPVRAFRNVRASLRDGGRLAMSVWRAKRENEFLYAVEDCVAGLLHGCPLSDAPTCGPGPFSLASPAVVTGILEASGFAGVKLERFDRDLCVGRDIDEALAFAMALGPAGELIRLAGPAAAERLDEIESALRSLLLSFARPDGVFAGSSTWLVTATAR